MRPGAPLRSVAAAAALATALAACGGAAAQTAVSPAPDALRQAPPEVDRSRPGDRGGVGPTGSDIVRGPTGDGGVPRGVVRLPAGVDPGIRTTVPDPTPNTTPVVPPPGAPGGDPMVRPR